MERSVLEGKEVISRFSHNVCGETEHVLEQVVAQRLNVKVSFLFLMSYDCTAVCICFQRPIKDHLLSRKAYFTFK